MDSVELKIQILRFLSETHRKLGAERRAGHARAFFTTLAFFAALVAARFSQDVKNLPSPSPAVNFFIWMAILIVAAIAVAHLLGVAAANRVNRELAQQAEGELMKLVGIEPPIVRRGLMAQVHAWEVAMIIVMSIAAGVSLTTL